MESSSNNNNYHPSYSYPDSGDSSPRSRDIDFDNPPPSWEDSSAAPNYKVKFMVSYNGKIQPRTHDNFLSYVGGDTKILAVDRNLKFSSLMSKLASLVSSDAAAAEPPSPLPAFTLKYQLPGEDLDALISVTNDDDLEHMMHEYDRMCRAASRPARLRLFVFPDQKLSSGFSSTSSDLAKGLDRGSDRFVDALNSGPVHHHIVVPDHNVAPAPAAVAPPPVQPPLNVDTNNVDFLFGLDKAPVQAPGKGHEPVGEQVVMHELNRLQISAQELHHQQLLQQQQQQAPLYRPKSDENLAGNYTDQYQKPAPQGNIPANMQIPAGYWQQVEQHRNHRPPQQSPPQQQPQPQYHPHQPVYMMHAPPPTTMFHAGLVRPMAASQGYYQLQQMPADQVYMEQQPVYTTPAPSPAVSQTAQLRAGENAGYTQVAYDSATGRQVFYTTAPQGGGVVAAPYQGLAGGTGVGGDMRSSGDGNVGLNVGPSSGTA